MNKLNSKDIKLLEKLYNLRSDDSVILVSLDETKNDTSFEKQHTEETKLELENKIDFLKNELETINVEGQDLTFCLTSMCQNSYEKVLDSVELSFDPDGLLKELERRLPDKISELENEINKSTNELYEVEEHLSELITKIEELDIRKEEALADRQRLNNYIDLALDNNINVTRDELTSLFEKLGFEENEQRQLAKLLMFPEDGLVDFDKNGGRPFENRFEEEIKYDFSKKEEPIMHIEPEEHNDSFKTFSFEEPNDYEEPMFESINFNDFFSDTGSNITDSSFESNFKFEEPAGYEFTIEEPTVDEPVIEEEIVSNALVDEPAIEEPIIIEPEQTEIAEEVVSTSKEEVIEYLTSLGFDSLDFANNDIDKIINNYNKEQITENVNLIKSLDMKVDVFVDNIELLFDKELKDKVSALTEVGKLPVDIYLNPDVLTKYDLSGLQNSINILKESGLEPKNVPLMAY